MVGLSGAGASLSCVGAGSPTFGSGATCFAGGDLKDWNSFANICVNVGGAIFETRISYIDRISFLLSQNVVQELWFWCGNGLCTVVVVI